jgi:hypothetical protein
MLVTKLFCIRRLHSKFDIITSFQMLKDGAQLLSPSELLTTYLHDGAHKLLCQLLSFPREVGPHLTVVSTFAFKADSVLFTFSSR